MCSSYSAYLEAAGVAVFEVQGHLWQRYKGVLMPAYLPHAIPPDVGNSALAALRASGSLLARWTEQLDNAPQSAWWYVLRDGSYKKQDLSSSTRSKLNRGQRRLEARRVSPDDLICSGYAVCVAASLRYGTKEFLPAREDFERRIRAAQQIAGSVEYWGVYKEGVLIAFSENHIEDNAVFMESIWYDPIGLRDYASYVLMDAILDNYLCQRNFKYVSDGSRSIYHDTGVHDFLVDKFGYRRAQANLRVIYHPLCGLAVRFARVAMPLISKSKRLRSSKTVRRMEALVMQDQIARSSC